MVRLGPQTYEVADGLEAEVSRAVVGVVDGESQDALADVREAVRRVCWCGSVWISDGIQFNKIKCLMNAS